MDKQRLYSYLGIKLDVESKLEQLARMKNDERIPAMKESDGSQRSGVSDHMANAVARRLDYEARIMPVLESKMAEMDAIEQAIESLPDPMERSVLYLRYIDGDMYRHRKWPDIAERIYGDCGEAQIKAVHRLHGRAIMNIREI